MGNVISGAALRSGMQVRNYALCNAAMAAMAYDSNQDLRKNKDTGDDLDVIFRSTEPRVTPDTHANTDVRQYGLLGKFNFQGTPRMYNFALPQDHALGVWSVNNMTYKADWHFHYAYEEQRAYPHTLNRFISDLDGIRAVTGLPEAMGYVTKSLTRTAGADLRTGDSIDDFQNMNNWGAGANHSGFNEEHSAQWKWSNQSTHLFWESLATELDINTAP
jgi:hypothetical protein